MPGFIHRRTIVWLMCAALFGALTGELAFMSMPARSVATSVVRIRPEHTIRWFREHALNRQSLADVIQREKLYERERMQMPMEDVLAIMRRDISVTSVNHADSYAIGFAYEDAAKAQRGNRALLARVPAEGLTIVQEPAISEYNQALTAWRMIGIGGLSAVLLVCWAVGLRRSPRVRRVTLAAAAGGLAAAVISVIVPANYSSASRLAVTGLRPLNRAAATSYFNSVSDRAVDRALAGIASRNGLSVRSLRQRITVTPDGMDEFLVAVTGNTPTTARVMAANVITALIETAYGMQREAKPENQEHADSEAVATFAVGGTTPNGQLKPNISGVDPGLPATRAQSAGFLLHNFGGGGGVSKASRGQAAHYELNVSRPQGSNAALGFGRIRQREQAGRQDVTGLEVLEPASLPDRPVSPNRLALTVGGLTLGLLFGLAGSLWRGMPAIG